MRPSNSFVQMSSLSVLFLLTLLRETSAQASNNSQPFSVTPASEFLGYDGQWSALSVRVGTPEQWLSLLPFTTSQETWVIGPGGCDGTFTCETKRGGLFYANQSSTFSNRGYYQLGFDVQLNDTGYAEYGLDTIALDDAFAASNQIIGVINTTSFWLGQLGLGVQETRFNGSQNHLPFLSSLATNGSLIPSHSYGYTAGANYRLKGVQASLTLGGVDTNRFTPNEMNFTLDNNYAPVLAINSISVSATNPSLPSNWGSNPLNLMSGNQAALFTIDSSTPFLWLPGAICDNFASALNLTYDNNLQLYLFNGTASPDVLTNWNLTFQFTLSNLPNGQNTVTLSLPYDAFNLQLSYPFPGLNANFSSPPTNYFPLRRALNNQQYTIGRAFLQETYLTVDYERNSFQLSQAVFDQQAVSGTNIVAIISPNNTSSDSSTSDLSTGAKAGIGVGVAAVAIAIIAIILVLFFRRKKKQAKSASDEKPKKRGFFAKLRRGVNSDTSVAELIGDKRHPTEVPADSARFELPGSTPVEMAAEEVPSTYLAEQNSSANGLSPQLRNNPRALQRQGSTSKQDIGDRSERSASPVPPYSPAEINQRFSSSISPYSTRRSPVGGTMSSGEQGISPVGISPGGHSRGSSQSQPPFSPVSPQLTSPPSQPSSGSGTNDSRYQTLGGNHLLSPGSQGRQPSRSASRSSRFREEGLSETVNDTNGGTNDAHSTARFSWEEGTD